MTIVVVGLINIETTLRIEAFPLSYEPVRYPFFGIQTTVSGVGYNIAKALTGLGNEVRLLALGGDDLYAKVVRAELTRQGIGTEYLLPHLAQTPQSVIVYDSTGRRAIHVDLKNAQEVPYPVEQAAALHGAQLGVLCNVNFSRALLAKARALGVPIATDIHAIGDLDDAYNRDYMAHDDILFQSHEKLPCPPDEWIRRVQARYNTPIIGIGLGADGALLAVKADARSVHVPAVITRPIVNTIGAGDALFSAFLHTYLKTRDPYQALYRAVLFASWKIGAAGAADGLLDAAALDQLAQQHPAQW